MGSRGTYATQILGVSYLSSYPHGETNHSTFGVQRVLESTLFAPSSFWSTPETDMAEISNENLVGCV